MKLSTTLYSFTNEYHQRKYSFAQLVRETARRGFGPGLEVVGFQSFKGFPDVSDASVAEFKALVEETGLVPTCLAINADIHIARDRTLTRNEAIDYHARQIRSASKLGFPVVRYQYAATPEVIRELVPLAEDLNVKLGLEIHAPQSVSHPLVLAFREMYAKVNSSYLGFIPDFGSSVRAIPELHLQSFRARGVPELAMQKLNELWLEDSEPMQKRFDYFEWAKANGVSETHAVIAAISFGLFSRQPASGWKEILPQVVHIHGKFYGVDDNGEEPSIDYEENLKVFIEGGYEGYISSEWEGHQVSDTDAFEHVDRHQRMVRRLLDKYHR